jgi:hypothetical protein
MSFATVGHPERARTALLLTLTILAAIRFAGSIRYDSRISAPMQSEAARVAYYLHKDGDWANPYVAQPTGPTAHEAPLFPALLAGLYKMFGDGGGGVLAVQALEALVLTGQIVMMPLLAASFGAGFEVACIAEIFAILGLGKNPYWEQNYVGLLLVLASLLAFRLLRATEIPVQNSYREQRGWLSDLCSPMTLASALGLLWGTILLMSPSPALVWLSWVALFVWKARRSGHRAWVPVALIPLLMLVPWTWRNYRVFHSPVLIRNNLGLELDVSNNSCASYSVHDNLLSGCFQSRHPFQNPEEAEKVIQLGESNYNRAKLGQTLRWIFANPASFTRLTLLRFVHFWFPTNCGKFFGFYRDEGPIQAWVIYPSTLLSIPGLVLLWRKTRPAAVICASLVLLYPPIYYLVQFDYRYRLPILWVSFFLAAVAIRHGVSLARFQPKAPGTLKTE